MRVTVRVDHCENNTLDDDIYSAAGHKAAVDLYDHIVENIHDDFEDVAVILNVSGSDISFFCSHRMKNHDLAAIELF